MSPRRRAEIDLTKAFQSLPVAAFLLGLSKSKGYRARDRGDFPVEILTINGVQCVRTKDVLALLPPTGS